ncbi:MAG: hypothetical protein Q7S58_01820 [Candidatus Binatus sp.]|uniref:hypothetical protein n=1 Tax=Candidatus Binatus sp. TaxID=2811406 RepID=UPI00271EC8BD|nr:hypothetical protein [Candidatus Binatus sp.]MDO8431127.1 hypothetical protein [Candidatus Binatus sp.]
MSIKIETGRGIYELKSAAPIERSIDSIVLTISLERADGIEKVALRCKISAAIVQADELDAPDKLIERIAPWIRREIEVTREAALKSIRSEHRLLEIAFDSANRGPFTS